MSLPATTQPFHVATGTEAEVCRDIATRQGRGVAKYGTTVAENPLKLREWLQHAYEETLDKAIYLKRAIQEIDTQPAADPSAAQKIDTGERVTVDPNAIASGHNPRKLTNAQVGVDEGWRLLTELEVTARKTRTMTKDIEAWLSLSQEWDSTGWAGRDEHRTYRTKMPAGHFLTN